MFKSVDEWLRIEVTYRSNPYFSFQTDYFNFAANLVQ
jgi:hypothetical protein